MLETRNLNDLALEARPVFFEFLARLTEAKIPVLIVSVLRDMEMQKKKVADGVSWTYLSKHLPQTPSGKSYAIDVVPYSIYELHGTDKLNWDETDLIWVKIGDIGQGLGLKWAVITKTGKRIDLGHFEFQPKILQEENLGRI